jgi:hypothetical protein
MKTNIDHTNKHITFITDSNITPSEFIKIVEETLEGRNDKWTVSTDIEKDNIYKDIKVPVPMGYSDIKPDSKAIFS